MLIRFYQDSILTFLIIFITEVGVIFLIKLIQSKLLILRWVLQFLDLKRVKFIIR